MFTKIKEYRWVVIVLVSLMLTACASEADDGKRTAISAKSIDWGYLASDGNDMRIEEIQVDKRALDSSQYQPFLSKINKNLVEEKKSEHVREVVIRFNKVGKLSQVYQVDEYDGKETTFYLEESIVSEYVLD